MKKHLSTGRRHSHPVTDPRGDTVFDPVCRMRFPRELAAATANHAGRVIYFCSSACQEQYAEDPVFFGRLTPEDSTARP